VKLLLVALGGAAGSIFRYFLSYRVFNNPAFPMGTFIVNASGSFLIGFLWGLSEGNLLSANTRVFLFVGLLGGFTTFSSFSIETMNLIRSGETLNAVFNILLNNVAGIALAFTGFFAAKLLVSPASFQWPHAPREAQRFSASKIPAFASVSPNS
jgi:CrcB protein